MILKRIAIIGSTGSIGVQALDVVRRNPDKLKVVALAAGSNAKLLASQAAEFDAGYAAVFDEKAYQELAARCDCWTGVGLEAVTFLASLEEVDLVLIAVSGAADLPYLQSGSRRKTVARNKESLGGR